MKIDFNGVEAPKNTERVSKVIEPGVQELVITDLQLGTAGTGTAYVEIHFNKPENPVEYPLRERFYVSPKAKPRFLAFLEGVLGRSFENVEVDTDQLKTELLNKRNTYVVDGEEYLKPNPTEGGKPFTNVRANLPFNNFINPPAGATHYIKRLVSDSQTDAAAATATVAKDNDDSDLPF